MKLTTKVVGKAVSAQVAGHTVPDCTYPAANPCHAGCVKAMFQSKPYRTMRLNSGDKFNPKNNERRRARRQGIAA